MCMYVYVVSKAEQRTRKQNFTISVAYRHADLHISTYVDRVQKQ